MTTTDLQPADERAPVAAEQPPIDVGAMMQQVIAGGATVPEAVATIRELATLHREMQADIARREWIAAMRAVHEEMPPIFARGHNQQTRSDYMLLRDIKHAARPLLATHGLTPKLSTETSSLDGHFRVTLTMLHVGGHAEASSIDVPVDTHGIKGSPVKTALHGTGSSLTYAEGRLYRAMLNIEQADNREDDDGQAGGRVAPTVSEQQQTDLRALIDEVGGEADLLAWAGVDTLADVPAYRFRQACRALEARRKP